MHKNMVNRVRNKLATRGHVKNIHGGGKQRTKRTPKTIRSVKRKICSNPRRSIRKLAIDHKMSKVSIRRLVKNDLGMKSRAVVTKNRINPNQMAQRKDRCKGILNWLKTGTSKETVLSFSDEKLFYVDPILKRRNVCYISNFPVKEVASQVKFNLYTKHASKVMVLGVIGSDGKKCPSIFVGDNEKINAAAYQGLRGDHVIPWLNDTYPSNNHCWTQDGSLAHMARTIQRLLEEEMSEFWGSKLWPPSAPEMSPLKYSIWSYLQE